MAEALGMAKPVPAAGGRGLSSFAAVRHAAIGALEAVSAGLVVAEFVILLCGTVARYAFNSPLLWADELASLLFLWLSVFGAAIALHRSEHMRLTTVLMWVPKRTAAFLETLGMVIVLALAVLLIPAAFEYAVGEWIVRTPALDLPDGLRGLALPVGLALFVLIGLERLRTEARGRDVMWAMAIVGAAVLALWMGRPMLLLMGKANLLVFFVLLVCVCVAIGVPIAFTFGVATAAYLLTVTRFPVGVMISRIDEGMAHLMLLSIPLFVLLGGVMQATGIARALVEFLAALLGRVRGGLQFVLIGAMYLVSGISGSKAADMAAVGPMLLPEMSRRGISRGEAVALLSATGAQTESVPPSFVLIILGSVAGVSVSALFTGGLLPALVAGLALASVCRWRARNEDMSGVERTSRGEIAKRLAWAVPALALPVIIRACVVQGVATATEVASIGVVYCLVAGVLIYRNTAWNRLYPIMVETASLAGAILLILGMATAMSWALTQAGFSRDLAAAMRQISGGPGGFIAISVVVFIALGSLLEGIPAIVLFAPLLFPISRGFGIHDVHYSIVAVMAMGIGLFTPPFGVGFYAACAIGQTPPNEVIPKIWPYVAALLAALVLIAVFPWLSVGLL